jgi:hypothetical protein
VRAVSGGTTSAAVRSVKLVRAGVLDAPLVERPDPDWDADAVLRAGVPVFAAVGAFRGRTCQHLEVR